MTSVAELMENDGMLCPQCGRSHHGDLGKCLISEGAAGELPELLGEYMAEHPYVIFDEGTEEAAGDYVLGILDGAGITYSRHTVRRKHPAPDELMVGEVFMRCPPDSDCIIVVGSGVLNDTGKILASQKHIPQVTVATAPSMDGFASASSAMDIGGLKVSLDTKCPDAVIGDTAILKNSPVHMIRSGIGDMLAKYVSLAEWKISHIINGEYYCPRVADLVAESLRRCVDSSEKAVEKDPRALSDLMGGLVLSGLTMNYAGMSRPASGGEHYISHIIDMRHLEFGTPWDLHGIQCGISTLKVIRAYEKLRTYRPDPVHAEKAAASFDYGTWSLKLRSFLGRSADVLIENEKKERKYDPNSRRKRTSRIVAEWDRILKVIDELPASDDLEGFMKKIGHPTEFSEIGISREEEDTAFLMTKDIRDKYVLSTLLWDLGIIDEFV